MRYVQAASALALAAMLAACGAKAAAPHAEEGAHGGAHANLGPADAHAAPAHGAESAHAPAPHGAPAGAHDAAHWAYNDQNAWAQLSGENAACAAGVEQSPINLASAAPVSELADLAPRYIAGPGAYINNGHTLQYTPTGQQSLLTIGVDAYALAQFHFHSPSEHLLDRRAYPLELHFVHKNQLGQLAVVGVFIEQGPPNPALQALIDSKPAGEGEDFATHLNIDAAQLLPADRTYFAYAGSLTTPPCSEGVRWNVLKTPITATAAQIAALREALGASSRHVQPVNERTVLLGL